MYISVFTYGVLLSRSYFGRAHAHSGNFANINLVVHMRRHFDINLSGLCLRLAAIMSNPAHPRANAFCSSRELVTRLFFG